MKYSMQLLQPDWHEQDSELFRGFLDEFGNLDFLGFTNLTKFGFYRTRFMGMNFNPIVFKCQYARKFGNEYNMEWFGLCDLFQFSLTNGGFGYTFNQADFLDQYISTWYTKEFSKIYSPKGFKDSGHHKDGNKDVWWNSTDNIFYPLQSGPKNGLTVTDY